MIEGEVVLPQLILVKHSLPEIVPEKPANTWQLSFEGHTRCRPLAEQLAAFQPEIVVCSAETKAIQTGQRVAETLNIGYEIVDNLHEHDRRNTPFGTKEQFEAKVAEFFARPDQRVFGRETADAAFDRFAHAVDEVIAKHAGRSVAIVTHGTVITLFVHLRATGITVIDPFRFWRDLCLPSFVVLSLPDFDLLTVVERVISPN